MTAEISIINELELREKIDKYNHFRYLSGREWGSIIATSFLILFINVFLFMTLLVIGVIVEVLDAAIWAGLLLILWLFLSFWFAKWILSLRIGKLKKMKYKKAVVFHSIVKVEDGRIYTQYCSIKKRTMYMNVIEHINGVEQMVAYPIYNNLFLPKNLAYGTIICRCSEEKVSRTKDLNVFLL